MPITVAYALWAAATLVAAVAWWGRRRRRALASDGGREPSPLARWAPVCLLLGIAAVAVDVWLVRRLRLADDHVVVLARLVPGAACLVTMALVTRGDRAAFGLCGPRQGVRYWLRALLSMAAIGAVFTALSVIALVAGWVQPIAGPVDVKFHLLQGLLIAPIVEEATYRLALCTPGHHVLGRWPTIVVSGLAFAALHVVYGNPAINNMLGGFLIAWSYAHSGSLVLPWLLHLLGNAAVLVGNVIWIGGRWS